jgi:hypothetical protein
MKKKSNEQFAMPTLGQFQKVLLDNINLWGNSAPELCFTQEPTEKDNQKSLNKIFKALDNQELSNDDFINANHEFFPNSKAVNTKLKSIQKNFQLLAKNDYYSISEYDDMEQYISEAIHASFDDIQIRQFTNDIRVWLIERYKFFITNHIPAHSSNASLVYFINGFAIPAVLEKIHLIKLNHENNFCFTVKNLVPNLVNSNVIQWPLAALVDELCRKANTTKYKLNQFHTLRNREPKSINSVDVWKSLSTVKNIEVCTKNKQRLERAEQIGKIKWSDFWEAIKPLQCLLNNITFEQLKFDAFIVFIFHATFQSLHKQLNSSDYAAITVNTTNLIVASLEKSKIIQKKLASLNNEKHKDYLDEYFMLEKEQLIGLSRQHGFSLGNQEHLRGLRKYYPEYIYELIQFELCEKITTECAEFTNNLTAIIKSKFWNGLLWQSNNIDHDHIPCLEEDIKQLKCDWMLNWFSARMAILVNDMPKALEHFTLAFTQAKYQSGELFYFLILDISAFCKIYFEFIEQQGKELKYTPLYEKLGGGIHKWSALIGYTSGSSRAHNLLPHVLNPEKNRKLMQDIAHTKQAMEKAVGAFSITKKGE